MNKETVEHHYQNALRAHRLVDTPELKALFAAGIATGAGMVGKVSQTCDTEHTLFAANLIVLAAAEFGGRVQPEALANMREMVQQDAEANGISTKAVFEA